MGRYSTSFDRDWEFYLANLDRFAFAGEAARPHPYDPKGADAKRAFMIFDSQGKTVPTSQPDLLASVICCKKAINLQIKQWAEGYEDCLLGTDDLLSEFDPPVPDWVRDSLHRQRVKSYRKRVAAGIALWESLVPGVWTNSRHDILVRATDA